MTSSSASSAVEGSFTGAVRLTLHGALRVETRNPESGAASGKVVAHDLQIDATCAGGKWDGHAWGFTPFIPGLEHMAKVAIPAPAARAEQAPPLTEEGGTGAFELTVRVEVNPNRQGPVFIGGEAEYTVKLKLDGNTARGEFAGRCTALADERALRQLERNFGFGAVPEEKDPRKQPVLANLWEARLADAQVSGKVTGAVVPYAEEALWRWMPQVGEHPRLLLRKADLPRIRALAGTPHGKAMVAKVRELLEVRGEWPSFWRAHGPLRGAALGFLYQLTGDRRYADEARDAMWGSLYTAYGYGQWWFHAYTLEGLAVAYDFCRDAWDDDTRRVFYAYLEMQVRQHAQRHDRPDLLGTDDRFRFVTNRREFVYSPDNDAARNDRFGACLAAMAILNDPPETVAAPKMDDVPVVAPAEGHQPWFGVPVLPYESDVMPRRWLINGPFLRRDVDNCAADAGGLDKLRPRPGEAITVDGVKLDWRLYRPAGAAGTAPGIYWRECSRYFFSATGGGYWPGIELGQKWREKYGKFFPTNVWLYTVLRNDAERVVQALPNWRSASVGSRMWLNGRRVRDGELVRIRPGLYPLLVDVALMGTYSSQSPRLRDYTPADERLARQSGRDAGLLAGSTLETNAVRQDLLAIARSARRYLRETVDERGYGLTSHRTLLPLLLAYRNVTGTDLAAGTGFEEAVPAAARFAGHQPDPLAPFTACQAYAMTPPRHWPLAAWLMRKYGTGFEAALDAVVALLTVPPDPPGEAPGGPARPPATGGKMPLAEHYERYGLYAFNSGLNGGDDFLTAVFTGSGRRASPWSAGGLTLQGLGRQWAAWREPLSPEDRQLNAMVVDGLFAGGPPRELGRELHPDGSGQVTLRWDRFVRGRLAPTGQSRGGRPVLRAELGSQPVAGASLLRSIAVDYSGRSGSPVLLAVADRVVLPRRWEKAWRIDLPATGDMSDPARRLKLLKNAFLLAGEQAATMKATFVLPQNVEFRARHYGGNPAGTVLDACVDRRATLKEKAGKAAFARDAKGRQEGDAARQEALGQKSVDEMVEEVQAASGPSPPVTFLVVLTVQPGEPPKVETAGTGDSTIARVGNRTVRFDGQRIVLGTR